MPFSLPLRPFQLSSKKRQKVLSLYERIYASESESNFRFISLLLGTRSKYVLTEVDRLDEHSETYAFLSDIGQYAEIAHGSISPTFVFQNIDELCQPGFPLDGYNALQNDKAILIQSFKGSVAAVQGFVALRPQSGQLVVAFSGTSNLFQALRDVQACKIVYPLADGRTAFAGATPRSRPKVHLGFWKMYSGIKAKVLAALKLAFNEHHNRISSLVLTGHSMGATLCYLLALDLMHMVDNPDNGALHGFTDSYGHGLPLQLVVFGSPRLGNEGLVQFYRHSSSEYKSRFGQESFREYSIKAYNDGVHVLPFCWMGYRHLTDSPLYLYHGHLYKIPKTQCEHGIFTVIESPQSTSGQEQGPLPLSHAHSHDKQRLTASVNQHAATSSLTASSSPSNVLAITTDNNAYASQAAPEPRFEHPIWPRGGHNYYFRDMENLQRRLKWLELELRGERNWKERYKLQLKMWEAKWGHPVVQLETTLSHGG